MSAMRGSQLLLSVILGFAACSSPTADPPATASPARVASSSNVEVEVAETVAYFAGGCFWGVEHYMGQIDGVLGVEAGFMSDLEAVEVRFDANRVSYPVVAQRFFEIHDPTQADGQGPDIGPEYRSAVFYGSPEQKQATEVLIERLVARGYAVVTEVREVGSFVRADDHHQDYYARTGKTPYCHSRVRRFDD